MAIGGTITLNPQNILVSKTSRPTPSTSPFKPGSSTPTELAGFSGLGSVGKSNLLSRLRAGSMPHRSSLLPSNPWANGMGGVYSAGWTSARDRTNTLASIRSSEGPSSPAQSHFSRDSLVDGEIKTLDYLGLVDTPQQARASLANNDLEGLLNNQASIGLQPSAIAALLDRNTSANRFRSYSVNAKEKYDDDDDDDVGQMYYSGTLTPEGNAAYANLHHAVRQHNLEVQAFANNVNSLTGANRPRARTAGVLDAPSSRMLRNYLPTPSRLDSSISVSDMAEEVEYSGLTEAVANLKLNGGLPHDTMPEEHNVELPTRALWLGNIPSSTTISSLEAIFRNFGNIESTRVLTHKNCGFVNFEMLDSAVRARSSLNGKEIFPGAGPVRIGYAKVPSASATPANSGLFPSRTPDPQVKDVQGSPKRPDNTTTSGTPPGAGAQDAVLTTLELVDIKADIIEIVKELGATEDDQVRIATNISQAIQSDHYETEIPPIPEPSHSRLHDAPKLRDIRKRIDNNTCTTPEIEEVAMNMLPEIAELSSDYLGNTVVQKLFEYCSEQVQEAMLIEIAPHLAEIGVHKNGTWAAQKIIDVARTDALKTMIVNALQPYGMALFLDQFGNYVMQGCLRYGSPMNNFIFDVMLSRLWELAQGRFGARAMRACLESHYATKDQQRMIAAAIALHSVQLATNANGALLLTWFLDTCTFPRRRSVLAPRLVPHLVQLCTHKVAYLTVLKIINQRNEPEARDVILKALFFSPNDQVLEDILSDQSCGATLIFKVLTTPYFDEPLRADVIQNVRNVLLRIKAQPQQGYKRLMDEVGLSTRSGGPVPRDVHPGREIERPGSKQSNLSSHIPTAVDTTTSRQFYAGMPSMSPAGFDPSMMQRTGSMESTGYDQFPAGVNGLNNTAFGANGNMQMPAITPQQMQYQQAMLATPARPTSFYPSMSMGMNGFPAPNPSVDAFRNTMSSVPPGMTGSPILPQSGFGQPNFSPIVGPGMYPYAMGYMNPQQQMGQVGAGRRGRVSPIIDPNQDMRLPPFYRDESPIPVNADHKSTYKPRNFTG
jgi:protein JSN1